MQDGDAKPSGDDQDPLPPTIAQQVPATPAVGAFSGIFSSQAFPEMSNPPADPVQDPTTRTVRGKLSDLLATEANSTLPQTGPSTSVPQDKPPPSYPDPYHSADAQQPGPDLHGMVHKLLTAAAGIQKFPRRAIIDQDWLILEKNFATRDNKSLGTTAAVVEDLFKVDKHRINAIIIA